MTEGVSDLAVECIARLPPLDTIRGAYVRAVTYHCPDRVGAKTLVEEFEPGMPGPHADAVYVRTKDGLSHHIHDFEREKLGQRRCFDEAVALADTLTLFINSSHRMRFK